MRACDADAYRYVKVWNEMKMQPLVVTEFCTFENASQWIHDKFDLVFQQNALDHAHDVPKAIDAMLELVAPGGLMVLFNMAEEATRQKYWGMHQWNFRMGDAGSFKVQGPGQNGGITNINKRVGERGWMVRAASRDQRNGMFWCPYRPKDCLQIVFSKSKEATAKKAQLPIK